jgi:zinc D-Ala-D-Ala carboxypeptidase
MAVVVEWNKYAPYFSAQEFTCSHTGLCLMQESFMDKLLQLRIEYAKPMHISSGYRDKRHPIEVNKDTTGAHQLGLAADLRATGAECYELLQIALRLGFTGIGINQRAGGRMLHLDNATTADLKGKPRPTCWTY